MCSNVLCWPFSILISLQFQKSTIKKNWIREGKREYRKSIKTVTLILQQSLIAEWSFRKTTVANLFQLRWFYFPGAIKHEFNRDVWSKNTKCGCPQGPAVSAIFFCSHLFRSRIPGRDPAEAEHQREGKRGVLITTKLIGLPIVLGAHCSHINSRLLTLCFSHPHFSLSLIFVYEFIPVIGTLLEPFQSDRRLSWEAEKKLPLTAFFFLTPQVCSLDIGAFGESLWPWHLFTAAGPLNDENCVFPIKRECPRLQGGNKNTTYTHRTKKLGDIKIQEIKFSTAQRHVKFMSHNSFVILRLVAFLMGSSFCFSTP